MTSQRVEPADRQRHQNPDSGGRRGARPYPNSVGKWQISTGGGLYPNWSRTPDPRPAKGPVCAASRRESLRVSIAQDATSKQDHVVFGFNFFEELRRLAPAVK